MKKHQIVSLVFAVGAIFGASANRIITNYIDRNQTQVRQEFQYPMIERDFCLKKGEEQTLTYQPGGFGRSYDLKVKYDGMLNEKDIAIYLQGIVYPTQIEAPIELGNATITNQKIQLTPLETIASGGDTKGILKLRFSAPKNF